MEDDALEAIEKLFVAFFQIVPKYRSKHKRVHYSVGMIMLHKR